MNLDQLSLISRFKGQQDNFQYGSAQLRAVLKVKHTYRIVRGDAATSSYASNQDETDRPGIASEGVMNGEYTRVVARSVNLRGLCHVLFACVVSHHDHPWRV